MENHTSIVLKTVLEVLNSEMNSLLLGIYNLISFNLLFCGQTIIYHELGASDITFSIKQLALFQ